MHALIFGLIAALAWAVHDLCVRLVSQRTGVHAALLAVLGFGAVPTLAVSLFFGGWAEMTGAAWAYAVASGAVFGLGSLSLYAAFAIGPVRLVAPIIGAYPILTVLAAWLRGAPVGLADMLAVLAIVAGVGLVAVLADDGASAGRRGRAIVASLVAGLGFALAFALGQAATRAGADFPVIVAARAAAFLAVLIVAMVASAGMRPARRLWPVLALMGALDATALGLVTLAGRLPNPEYAAVAASTFGMLTVVLAWAVLGEGMRRAQWASVALVFGGIAALGL